MTTPIVLPNCDPTKHRPDGSHSLLCFAGAVPGLVAARLGDCDEDHGTLVADAVAACRAALITAVKTAAAGEGNATVTGWLDGDTVAAVLDLIRDTEAKL